MTTFSLRHYALAIPVGVLLVMSACAPVQNSGRHVTDVQRRHKINVASQFVTTPVEVSADAMPLTLVEADKLSRIVTDFVKVGGGTLEISVPKGTGTQAQAQARANVIRSHAIKLGAQRNEIIVRQTGIGSDGPVIVSYERFTATPPNCGPTVDNMAYNTRNVSQDTFGCVTQHNLATMISNPRDLVKMRRERLRDANRSAGAIPDYRGGEDPSRDDGARSGSANSF